MGFCPKCGTDVGNANFCPKCGNNINAVAPAQTATVSTLEAQKNVRMETAEELTKIFSYFDKKKDLYDEYDVHASKVNKYLSSSKIALLVWGIILLVIGLLIAGFWLVVSPSGLNAPTIVTSFVCSSVVNIPGIIMVIVYAVWALNKKHTLDSSGERMAKIEDELSEYYKKYGYCALGIEYSHPDIIRTLADIVRAGRADTIKEAINVMLDDAHKSQMELQAMLTAQSADAAARNSGTAAANSGVAAAFSVASFLLR